MPLGTLSAGGEVTGAAFLSPVTGKGDRTLLIRRSHGYNNNTVMLTQKTQR